jgi:hypothetical protein
MLRRFAPRAAPAIVLAVVAGGCAGSGDARAEASSPVASVVPPHEPTRLAWLGPEEHGRRCTSPVQRLRSNARAYRAVVRERAIVFDRPDGRATLSFGAFNQNGVPTVLGVLARRRCGEFWYRVQLPVRPNGATGWVRSRDVRLVRVRGRISVDLSSRRLTVLRDGRTVLRAVIAYGTPETPTPTGDYYVNQKLVAPDPAGPFGPAALGISAFSPTLAHWAQGGPIAIHGTNRPELLGAAVSNGCIRVRNDVLLRVWKLAPEGTPVSIRT